MLSLLEYEVVREYRRDLLREAEKGRLVNLVKRTVKRLENDRLEPVQNRQQEQHPITARLSRKSKS